MSELKPCPFCGSGWLYETMINGYCNETPTMFCNSCKAVVTWEQVEEEGVNDDTRTFVREHWNTRAERTCKRITLGLEREREIATVSWICSACGKHINKDHDYCHNCGARVIGEWES